MGSPISFQNPYLDSELIGLYIHVLEKSDYLGSVLIVSNQIAYWGKTNGYKWWRVLYHIRILIWTQNWSDSASEFWKSWIILESALSFPKKMHIQLKQMYIYQFRLDYTQWRALYDARVLSWTRNWSDSASEFWKSRIISEAALSFLIKLYIQVKLMHISDEESCIMSESLCGLEIDQTLHPSFGKVGLSWKRLDPFEPNCIFK